MAEVNALHPGISVNDEKAFVPRRYSTLDTLSYRQALTARYGEYFPFFDMDVLNSDTISFGNSMRIDTMSLKAPFLSDINLRKNYFVVYHEVALPFNSQKITDNPTVGDDVDSSVNTCTDLYSSSVNSGLSKMQALLISYIDYLHSDTFNPADFYAITIKVMTFLEMFFSHGGLINSCGTNLSGFFIWDSDHNGLTQSFDKLFDAVINKLLAFSWESFTVQVLTSTGTVDRTFTVRRDVPQVGIYRDSMSFRSFLQFARESSFWVISNFVTDADIDIDDFRSLFYVSDENFVEISTAGVPLSDVNSGIKKYNFVRPLAYQFVCHHFFSNDTVDYIYSAELFREQIHSLLQIEAGGMINDTFLYNQINTPYDWCSGHYMDRMFSRLVYNPVGTAWNKSNSWPLYARLDYFYNIFSFRRSLRFVDYFTGSKSRPLAVGDTTIDVNNNKVDVIDITRQIQTQRFLNAVNRFGRKFGDYMQGLFGVRPSPDFHDPGYLAHTSDVVSSRQIDNTGDLQFSQENSRTSIVGGKSADYEFTASFDRFATVIGIAYFEIPRIYSFSSDKSSFFENRFDMFNPFLAFTGDESIMRIEMDSRNFSSNPFANFAYTQRYNSYRQRVSRAVGGFVENLPGWMFPSDNIPGVPHFNHIGPDFIRSYNTEMDQFFVNGISGYSLASYFHFIIISDNIVTAKRPIPYQSQIL